MGRNHRLAIADRGEVELPVPALQLVEQRIEHVLVRSHQPASVADRELQPRFAEPF